jgi:prepilin-type N-terminal cleavage/methylation domain-containing protein
MNRKGFTLIEILVVIGILTVLFAIVIVAINPSRQFSLANNTKRKSDTKAILDAIHEYAADHRGVLPVGIRTTASELSKTNSDLCSLLVTQYIAALPVDPQTNNGTAITDCNSNYSTNYFVVRSTTDNRIMITAPGAELGEIINVIR